MTVSPPLNPILMLLEGNGSLSGRDRAGSFSATGVGALRYAPAPGSVTNLLMNPSFEFYSPSQWGVFNSGGATSTADFQNTEKVRSGSKAAKVLASNIGGPSGGVTLIYGNAANNYAPIDGPTQVTHSVYVYTDDANVRARCQAAVYDDSGNNSQASAAAMLPIPVGVWTRISYTFTYTIATAARIRPQVQIDSSVTGSAQSATVWIDDFQIELGDTASPYVDASQPGSVSLWPRTGQLGTPHQSPAVSRAVFWAEEGTTNLILNPSGEATFGSDIGITNIGTTITRDQSLAYIGVASARVVCDGTAIDQGCFFRSAVGIGTTSTRTFQGSVMMRGSGTVTLYTRATYTDASQNETASVTINLTNGWVRYVGALLVTNPAKTLDYVSVRVRVNSAQAVTWFMDCAQVEEKAYPTSICIGDMGSGYTWAGTGHASTSTRTNGYAQVFSLATRLLLPAGAIMARNRLIQKSGAFPKIAQAGQWLTSPGDSYILMYNSNGGYVVYLEGSSGGIGGGSVVQLVAPDGVFSNIYAQYDGQYNRMAVGNGAITQGTPRTSPQVGAWQGTSILVGDGQGGKYVGPFITYDGPLSDARRAMVNAAIDSNGATDLWTLFEELELINLPANPLELPSGVGKAGASLTNINGELLQMGGNEVSVGADLIHVPQSLDVQTSRSSIGTMLDNQHRNLVLEDTSKIFALPYEVTVDWSGV